MGHSAWGCEESDTTERLTLTQLSNSAQFFLEGRQSCLKKIPCLMGLFPSDSFHSVLEKESTMG